MLHLLDAAGTMITAADAPPLDGLYPTNSWLAGQVLDDRHCFAQAAQTLQIGLYTLSDGVRLPITSAGSYTIVDDSLQIPLK